MNDRYPVPKYRLARELAQERIFNYARPDLPPKGSWIIAPRGDTNEQWGAWKTSYMVNEDKELFIPLNYTFKTPQEAHEAVREFLSSVQPVYLDENGEVIGG